MQACFSVTTITNVCFRETTVFDDKYKKPIRTTVQILLSPGRSNNCQSPSPPIEIILCELLVSESIPNIFHSMADDGENRM
jgi:hypothetical protein